MVMEFSVGSVTSMEEYLMRFFRYSLVALVDTIFLQMKDCYVAGRVIIIL